MGKTALVVVDMQNDFVNEDGALPVPGAKSIIPAVNSLIYRFKTRDLPVFFTYDCHDLNSSEFKKFGKHCIIGSHGSKIHNGIDLPQGRYLIPKSTFSAFDDQTLKLLLKILKVDTIVVCGVATEYCVAETAIDAAKNGFITAVATDAVKAISTAAEDEAITKMTEAGITGLTSDEVERKLLRND